MNLTQNILEEIILDDIILYNGNIELNETSAYGLSELKSCFIYEINSRINPKSGQIDISFIVELEYEITDDVNRNKIGWRKLSVNKSIIPEKSGMSLSHVRSAAYLFLNIVEPEFKYKIFPDKNQIDLVISAKLKGYVTGSYYSNVYRCMDALTYNKKDRSHQSEKDISIEPIDWQTILDSVNFNDILAVFDSFLKLVSQKKTVRNPTDIPYDDKNNSENDLDQTRLKKIIKMLEDNNAALQNEIINKKSQMEQYHSELESRNLIIDKLLSLMNNAS